MAIELGKPADYGQYILQRRYALAKAYAREAFERGGFYLDVGCGNGAQTVLFAKHFTTWMAIDVEEERLNEFRRVTEQITNYELRITNIDPTLASIRNSQFVIRNYN